jgi:hypothetical protein
MAENYKYCENYKVIDTTGMLLGEKVKKQPFTIGLERIAELTTRIVATKMAVDRPAWNSEQQALVRSDADDEMISGSY